MAIRYKINGIFLGMLMVVSTCCAKINFGNKTSSIIVGNTAVFDIRTPENLEVDAGNITNNGGGIITGKPMYFKKGVFSFFQSASDISGTVISEPETVGTTVNQVSTVLLGADNLIDGGTMIANPGGLLTIKVRALPGSNLMRGQPLFFGEQDLSLRDNTSLLAVAIQNTLNTNIRLAGGTLFLQDDLRLGDDAVILDSGTVVFNNRKMSLSGKLSEWNGTILWNGARDLQLNSAISLKGTWMFKGEGQINGSGNVIDIAGQDGVGGSIVVLPGATLRLAGVHIKGLGLWGSIKLAPDATLILSDVVLEMGNDYIFSSGTIFIEGNSTVITKDHILEFQDSPDGTTHGTLIVDRVALTYDTLASIDRLNIRPPLIQDPERKFIQILGEGEIRTIRSDTVTFHNYRAESRLQKYAIVAPYRKFQIFPEVLDGGGLNYNVVIDGNTNFLGFTRTDEGVFIVSQNVQATTQNIIMRDVSPKHILLEPGASLTFGDRTTISLARNEYLDYPWIFEGETLLRGAGNIFELGPNGAIILKGNGSKLLLDGITIKGISENNVRCEQDDSTLQLKNVKWIQDGDCTFDHGTLEILDDVTMVGGFNTIAGTQTYFTFIYTSNNPFIIGAHATLSLIRDMIFRYAPADFLPTHFQFADASAALFMNQSTLEGRPSLQLSTGRLIVRDRNFLRGAVNLGTDLLLDKPSGATLEPIGG